MKKAVKKTVEFKRKTVKKNRIIKFKRITVSEKYFGWKWSLTTVFEDGTETKNESVAEFNSATDAIESLHLYICEKSSMMKVK
jgi:hypothetical protein